MLRRELLLSGLLVACGEGEVFRRRPGAWPVPNWGGSVGLPDTSLAVPSAFFFGFSSDNNPAMPYNPNFKYHDYTNPGTIAGTWGATGTTGTIYDNRLLRQRQSFSSGTVLKWAAHNTNVAGHNLTFGGLASDVRFLHDGSTGYNLYCGLLPRSTLGQRIVHSTTSSLAAGILLQCRNGNQQISFAVGGSVTPAINLVTSGSKLTTGVPHCVTIFVEPFSSIGALGATCRIDNNATDSVNYGNNPFAGDAATTLKLMDTVDGHVFEIWATPKFAAGSTLDLAWKAFVEQRSAVGLTPDAWTEPNSPRVCLAGDSITDCTLTLPTARWCELITLSQYFELHRNAQAGKEVGPSSTAGTMLDPASQAIDDGFYTALARCVYGIWGATNDYLISRPDTVVIPDLATWITNRKALGSNVRTLATTTLDRHGFNATTRGYRDAGNNTLKTIGVGSDAVLDIVPYFGNDHSPWDAHPEYFVEASPNETHPSALALPFIRDAYTPVLEQLVFGP